MVGGRAGKLQRRHSTPVLNAGLLAWPASSGVERLAQLCPSAFGAQVSEAASGDQVLPPESCKLSPLVHKRGESLNPDEREARGRALRT